MKLLVDDSETFTRVALVDKYELVDIIWEEKGQTSIVGNIYLGVIQVVLPSEFAFIDIGESKAGFLQLNDPKEQALLQDKKWNKGQSILVQVIKDAQGKKGPHLTSQISLSSPELVLLSTQVFKDIGVSRKIEEMTERKRLQSMGQAHIKEGESIIFRTQSEHMQEQSFVEIYNRLSVELHALIEKSIFERPPILMKGERSSIVKAVRDLYHIEIEKIIVNNRETRKLLEAAFTEDHAVETPLETFENPMSLFEYYNVESQIRVALAKRVNLPCGGFLIIEKTEACWVIDVNSGSFQGEKSHEATVMTVNMEAATAISKQLRLRNLSGIIMVDFLGIQKAENKLLLRESFESRLQADPIPTFLEETEVLGLYFITRKKTRQSLMDILFLSCDKCGGTGNVRHI